MMPIVMSVGIYSESGDWHALCNGMLSNAILPMVPSMPISSVKMVRCATKKFKLLSAISYCDFFRDLAPSEMLFQTMVGFLSHGQWGISWWYLFCIVFLTTSGHTHTHGVF